MDLKGPLATLVSLRQRAEEVTKRRLAEAQGALAAARRAQEALEQQTRLAQERLQRAQARLRTQLQDQAQAEVRVPVQAPAQGSPGGQSPSSSRPFTEGAAGGDRSSPVSVADLQGAHHHLTRLREEVLRAGQRAQDHRQGPLAGAEGALAAAREAHAHAQRDREALEKHQARRAERERQRAERRAEETADDLTTALRAAERPKGI